MGLSASPYAWYYTQQPSPEMQVCCTINVGARSTGCTNQLAPWLCRVQDCTLQGLCQTSRNSKAMSCHYLRYGHLGNALKSHTYIVIQGFLVPTAYCTLQSLNDTVLGSSPRLLSNSTGQKFIGRCRGHLIQMFNSILGPQQWEKIMLQNWQAFYTHKWCGN